MKTLYLNENKKLNIIRDGPSLWIRQGNKGSRVPCRLVDRVVIYGNVSLDTNILIQFAEKGAPVVFYDPRGNRKAYCAGPSPISETLLQTRLEDPMWVENAGTAFQAWEQKERFRLIRKLFPDQYDQIRDTGIQKSLLEQRIKKMVAQAGSPQTYNALFHFIQALMDSLVLKTLIQCRFDPHRGILHPKHHFGLLRDFNTILQWEIQRLALLMLEKNPPGQLVDSRKPDTLSASGRFKTVRRFELKKQKLEKQIQIHIKNLYHLLRE